MFMKGLDPALINAANKVKVDEVWSVNGDEISYGMHSELKRLTETFKLDVEFKETSPAGRVLMVSYRPHSSGLIHHSFNSPFD